MRRNFLMIFSLLLLLGSCVDGVKKEYRQRLDLSGDWHSSLGEINLPSTTDEAKLGNKISDTLNSQRLSRKYSYVGDHW